jgi:hypothetical protein
VPGDNGVQMGAAGDNGVMPATPASASHASAAADPRKGVASVRDLREGTAAAVTDKRDGRAAVTDPREGTVSEAADPHEGSSRTLGGGWGHAAGSEWVGEAPPGP